MCGYKVPGIILLQTHLYTHSLLGGVTFEVPPLSSFVLSLLMLPLIETFLDLLMWNSFQWRRHIFWISSISWNIQPFKTAFIFGNSQKSFGAKSGEQGGCSISVIDFWARNCFTESALWAGILSWWRIQSLDQSPSLFLRVASHNHIRTLVGT